MTLLKILLIVFAVGILFLLAMYFDIKRGDRKNVERKAWEDAAMQRFSAGETIAFPYSRFYHQFFSLVYFASGLPFAILDVAWLLGQAGFLSTDFRPDMFQTLLLIGSFPAALISWSMAFVIAKRFLLGGTAFSLSQSGINARHWSCAWDDILRVRERLTWSGGAFAGGESTLYLKIMLSHPVPRFLWFRSATVTLNLSQSKHDVFAADIVRRMIGDRFQK